MKITRRTKILVAVLLVTAAIPVAVCVIMLSSWPYRMHASDEWFVMLENEPSQDGESRLLMFQYDTGAFGYSRVFWAVTPYDYTGLNLAKYTLPDGYKGVGWTEEGELIVEEWEPYYFVDRKRDLKTGDTFKGVPLIVRELQGRG